MISHGLLDEVMFRKMQLCADHDHDDDDDGVDDEATADDRANTENHKTILVSHLC